MEESNGIDLTVLKEYVYGELVRLGCSIEFIGITTYETLSRGLHPLLKVIFNRGSSRYFAQIESTNIDEGNRFDTEVSVECPLNEDQLPPLKSLNTGDNITIIRLPNNGLILRLRHRGKGVFICNKQDNLDVAEGLVEQIFEISKI